MTNIFAIINEHKLHLDDIIRKTPNRKTNGNRKLPIKIYPDKFFEDRKMTFLLRRQVAIFGMKIERSRITRFYRPIKKQALMSRTLDSPPSPSNINFFATSTN